MHTPSGLISRRRFVGSAAAGVAWFAVFPTSLRAADAGKLLVASAPTGAPLLARRDDATGQYEIREAGQLVLRYNYQTIEPGERLAVIAPANRIYARARSNYIHPLYGLDGEELTKDWSVDHPHHRGIYWAWPEVDWRGQRGDLHALQKVLARPTGHCTATSGPGFAQIEAENLWKWNDQDPIVREVARLRVYRRTAAGRLLDLEFRFTALDEPVLLARRGANAYGGLNLRMAAVKDQQIAFHTDPPEAKPRMAWAEMSGQFSNSNQPAGVVVLQHPQNPHYPGDWVKFPELNWFQPTFPASGTRYELKKDVPLGLRFRLWIHSGPAASVTECIGQWQAMARG